jgi:hypothetical protein
MPNPVTPRLPSARLPSARLPSARLLSALLFPALIAALLVAPLSVVVQPTVARAQEDAPPAPPITLTPLGTYATGVFDGGAAEIVAYDPLSQQAYVTNRDAATLDILDVSDPSAPTLVSQIDLTPYGASANSVDVYNGIVAVAIEAEKKTKPGAIVFFTSSGSVISSVQAGAKPDMLTFTPDGAMLLAANEGEPNNDYAVDPEGSITIVDLSQGVEGLTQQDVALATFETFNDFVHPLVRIFGPNATVAQDLEPEYIAVSPDSSTAWVTLQENNAIAVVDLATREITDVLPLGLKDHSRPLVLGIDEFAVMELDAIGETPAGQEILMGGFSGLWFEGVADDGSLLFLTHTDRGPNADAVDVDGDGRNERPFALPDFQPQVLRLALNPADGTLTVLESIGLSDSDGTPLTGLPNLRDADERPVDLTGADLPYDALGGDFEGMAVADDGSLWMVDEYRPALYHFSAEGMLINRFVPEGANDSEDNVVVGTEALPEVLNTRRPNRGFEAIALDGDLLYAFVQSPLDNPPSPGYKNSKEGRYVRIIAFDMEAGETVGQYLYRIERNGTDKIGDAVALGNGEFLVLERDESIGADAGKFIFRISLDGATNLEELSEPPGLELQSDAALGAAGIRPVLKQLYVHLPASGYLEYDKPEGLALIDDETLAIINDNDFGISGDFDLATGVLEANPDAVPSVLALLHLKSTALDSSDRDGGIQFGNPPVLGMFQPDAIAAYDVDGESYLVTANEGDARDYAGFSEATRVRDLVLDLSAFPNAAELQKNANLGRLRTTTAGTDLDLDGRADVILSYGARSFSIWDSQGRLVWDSGDDFERLTAELLPDAFNSSVENGTFDARSDYKGPEPEAVTVGVLGDRTYAFIGLERIGGVMVYDISNPFAPEWVGYVNNRDFGGNAQTGSAGDLAPEGLAFVSAEESPTGEPLLIVSNEVSGSTTLYAIEVTEAEEVTDESTDP